MTANDQIAELNRQRAEKHRLTDEEYDARVRMVTHVCERLEILTPHHLFGFVTIVYHECKHCGADVSAQSTQPDNVSK